MRLFLILLLLSIPKAFSAQCGMVNGAYVCTEPPGCGEVDGVYTCAEPPGCGYVDGVYNCSVPASESPKTPGIAPPASGQTDKANAGEIAGLEWLSGFFAGDGSDTWLAGVVEWGVKKAVVASIKTKLWAIKTAWGVSKSILQDMHVFDQLGAQLNALPPDVQSTLAFFNLFSAISTMLTAAMTRFVLRFVPGGF